MTYNVTEHFAGMTEAERNAAVVYVERAKLTGEAGLVVTLTSGQKFDLAVTEVTEGASDA